MGRDSSVELRWRDRLVPALCGALATSFIANPLGVDPPGNAPRPLGKVAEPTDRKGTVTLLDVPLRGTLVDTHSPVRLALDDSTPTAARFNALLADPVLGGVHDVNPALLGLLRALAANHPLARVDVVSGFRSPKLNETLRKKGHHVALHSQHSLGQALDLRVIPAETALAIDPLALAREVRGLGWNGGVGIYLGANDRFVHADVGPLRTWYGQ
jgi:uncharacterized protein YcbK (DUF882 family)